MGKRTLRTKLCDLLGIEYPILSAGMGPTLIGEKTGAPVELVVAVSEAGGLGVLGGSGFTVDELRDAIREIKSLTDKPYGVDLLLPKRLATREGMEPGSATELPLSQVLEMLPKPHLEWIKKVKEELQLPDTDVMLKLNTTTMLPKESIQVCIEERVPLFCAGLGNPGFMVEDAHAVGMKVLGITGNVKNGRRIASQVWISWWLRATREVDIRAGSEPWHYCPRSSTWLHPSRFWPPVASETAEGLRHRWPWGVLVYGLAHVFWPQTKGGLWM